MPKSKRAKVVTLSKVKRKDRTRKEKLLTEVRESISKYARVFVFEIENNKSSHVQVIRSKLTPGRMFYGKNKVMITALGGSAEEEICDNIHNITKYLKGHRGLLFTDRDTAFVQQVFNECQPDEFAKSGFIATETIILPEGADSLSQFPHSMEAQLRLLGLPTLLKSGVIYLMGDTPVCTKGVELTVEAAQLLKLLGIRMAKFRMKLIASWDNQTTDIVEF